MAEYMGRSRTASEVRDCCERARTLLILSQFAGHQLRSTRYRQHGGSGKIRQRDPEAAMANSIVEWRYQIRFPHDRARRCI